MKEIAARIEETRRIRRGLYAHLGERVFNQVVADPDLRNGKEEVLGAIAACNRELGRLEDAAASLDARLFAARQVGDIEDVREGEPVDEPERPAGPEFEQSGDKVSAEPADGVAAVAADLGEAVTDLPVTVVPVEPIAPAPAPDPVTIEPVTLDAVPATETELATQVTGEGTSDEGQGGSGDPTETTATDAADEVAAAPTIVLNRDGADVADGVTAAYGAQAETDAEPADENVAESVAETGGPSVCPNCGEPVEPEHRFCMSCGCRLRD
jgi:hypothetical protein